MYDGGDEERRREEEAEEKERRVGDKKQEPHTEMWGKRAKKINIYRLFGEGPSEKNKKTSKKQKNQKTNIPEVLE